MLIDDFFATKSDAITSVVARVNNKSDVPIRVMKGVYEIGHFGHSHWPEGYDNIDMYGVCDKPEQIFETFPQIVDSPSCFLVTLTRIVRSEQPAQGGWRWEKWGEYIGDYKPMHEYLYDETIEQVFVFQVYERV